MSTHGSEDYNWRADEWYEQVGTRRELWGVIHRLRDREERVREWATEPIPSGEDPYQKGIQHAKDVVRAILNEE